MTNSANVSIQITNDGSHTLYVEALDETYHSRNGAMEESLYVFINKGLNAFVAQNPDNKTIQIFEVGFGTGLNAILTFIAAQKLGIHIIYHGIEAFPLAIDLVNQLNYNDGFSEQEQIIFKQMHEAKWNFPFIINNQFTLVKYHNKLENFTCEHLQKKIHIIYMDAFAPNKQAELWELAIFEKLFKMMDTNGILVTYTAKGDVKRAMKQVGFEVERLDGPPRKRHMLRGKNTNN
jgi:tRNA U34 5-methylaminomethyl-2-thiouridine-forming methyltransferase MnmC